MKEAIVALGYRPRIVQSRLNVGISNEPPSGKVPEPIATALQQTRKTDTPVFVDFYAGWCGACKIMDQTTLIDAGVVNTLKGFHFVKVDAERYLEATEHFGVVGMPTYIVLSSSGEELFHQVGPIDAENLVHELSTISSR